VVVEEAAELGDEGEHAFGGPRHLLWISEPAIEGVPVLIEGSRVLGLTPKANDPIAFKPIALGVN
jgi:hypothetical protein